MKDFIKKYKTAIEYIIAGIAVLILGGTIGLTISKNENGEIKIDANYSIELSDEQIPAVIEDDKGELVEDENIPTVESVDGGQFEDKDTGVSAVEGEYDDLGWSEWYPTDTPDAFKNATLGRCIIANNKFGAQCVSLSRVFWWSYADRDVSTCGTGMAKGMMNCADQNAGDDFEVIWDRNQIQSGTWVVFGGGQYGHVGMALGPVVNGYVSLLGENQGGHSCGDNVGGSATNIININVKDFIGGYTPKSYIKPEPTPEPEPVVVSCDVIDVKRGDTMGDIMKKCEGKVVWGKAMKEYAKTWKSIKYRLYPTVYDGWMSAGHYGLFAGDTIQKIK